MKKLTGILCASALLATIGLSSCGENSNKVITVCASDVPHAEILNEVVKEKLASNGYDLRVSVLDWETQNDAVAQGDYDANYFQHVPYLTTYTGTTELTATCKVHYEPLGIYKGKDDATLDNVKTIEICDDDSNAIRAFQLLQAKNILTDIPVSEDGTKLTFEGKEWTSSNGIKVTLIAENLLASSKSDYDIACLPCNTALTGNISSESRLAVEDSVDEVTGKANVLAVRKADYKNNADYKAKIDALTDALLSDDVKNFVSEKYKGVIICDSRTQIDLRSQIN